MNLRQSEGAVLANNSPGGPGNGKQQGDAARTGPFAVIPGSRSHRRALRAAGAPPERTEKSSHAVGKKPAGPASAPGDGEGRMWLLFPQTSSSNLNNNLYLPPRPRPPPGFGGSRSGRRGQTHSRGRPGSSGSLAAPRSAPRSRAPAAARGPEGLSRGGNGLGAGGWAAGSAPRRPAGRVPGPPRSRASPPTPPAAAAPRVTSGQIQRDVLLAAVIPPCAKQTHNPG